MNDSMLWPDNRSISIETKINQGASHYNKTHGKFPDTCLVYPSDDSGESGRKIKLDGGQEITIRHYAPVLKSNLLFGMSH